MKVISKNDQRLLGISTQKASPFHEEPLVLITESVIFDQDECVIVENRREALEIISYLQNEVDHGIFSK